MINHSTLHLGKRPRRHDARTLKMARYVTSQLPQAPAKVDYSQGVTDWGMMLNDQLGDCTIADGPGHATQVWTLNATGTMVTPPDSAVLEAYEKWCGYDPADPGSDQGGVELDVLKHWRKEGFCGHSLKAFVAVDLGTRDSDTGTRGSGRLPPIATAIWLFGGAYIGVELPLCVQDQEVWDVVPSHNGSHRPSEPGSWGGHAVYLVGYDLRDSGLRAPQGLGPQVGPGTQDARMKCADSNSRNPNYGTRTLDSDPRLADPVSRVPYPVSRTLTCITWGGLKKMTWAWFEKYCSEAYALVSRDWLDANGVSPSGFDLKALEADLAVVTAQGEI